MSGDQNDSGVFLDDRGILFSQTFEDVYFSAESPLQECHHVFATPLLARDDPPRVLCELGFGTGLNFLTLWAGIKNRWPGDRWAYIAIEGFPLPRAHAEVALNNTGAIKHPDLGPLAQDLLEVWPDPIPGVQRRVFGAGDLSLTLYHGPVDEQLALLGATLPAPGVDGWLLDGFAPARNPDMWRAEILHRVGQLSAPNARLGTFTAARAVRDGLEAAGFAVTRVKGHGRKRHCLQAIHPSGGFQPSPESWSAAPPPLPPGSPVLVIGAGVAGLAAAQALQSAGLAPQLLEAEPKAALGGSGNPAGLMMPRLALQPNPGERFLQAAYLYGLHRLERQTRSGHALWVNQDPSVPGGIIMPPGSAQAADKHRALLDTPPLEQRHLQRCTADDARLLLGDLATGEAFQAALDDGSVLYHPTAGCLRPRAVCAALAEDLPVILNKAVHRLIQQPGTGEWIALDRDGAPLGSGAAVVLASGPLQNHITIQGQQDAPLLPSLRISRGQLSLMAPPDDQALRPSCGLAYGPYVSPAFALADPIGPLAAGHHVQILGASYQPISDPLDRDSWSEPRDTSHQWCLDKLRTMVPVLADHWQAERPLAMRTALRAETADRLPLVGPLPLQEGFLDANAALRKDARRGATGPGPSSGLWVLGGMGSRGFQTAHLSAALLADLMTGAPLPCPQDQMEAVHPARFAIRDLKRNLL